MGSEFVSPIRIQRNKSLLASRCAPVLIILVSFVITANVRCDHVGMNNATEQVYSGKPDPLSMLREIYFDQNSKLTMLLPTSDQVQKFHPNGRYGRRSVNNMAEPSSAHSELGKLNLDSSNNDGRLRSILNNLQAISAGNQVGRRLQAANPSSRLFKMTNSLESQQQLQQQQHDSSNRIAPNNLIGNELDSSSSTYDSGFETNYQQELSKLLKCNYTGLSNLYWCDNGAN